MRSARRRTKPSSSASGTSRVQAMARAGASRKDHGQGGIRTHGTLAGTPVFETGRFNHSRTCPLTARYEGPSHLGTSVPIRTDRVGFEPTKRLPVYTLSRRVPSATRPPIQPARRADLRRADAY